MARPQKKGLDYFPFDVDFFSDIRIRKLLKYQGGDAITVYALLLCYIYKNGYYIGEDKELPFIISEQTGCGEAHIQEIIRCCLNIGLFSKELYEREKVFTSRGIQRRYVLICKSSHRKADIGKYNLISSEETRVSSEETRVSSEKSTQRKGKEIKEDDDEEDEEDEEGAMLDKKFICEKCRNFAAYWRWALTEYSSGMPELLYPEDHRDGIMRLYKNFSKQEVAVFVRNAMQHPFLNRRRSDKQGSLGFDWATASMERIRKIIENQQYLK